MDGVADAGGNGPGLEVGIIQEYVVDVLDQLDAGLGLVVTPAITPMSLALRISSTLAISMRYNLTFFRHTTHLFHRRSVRKVLWNDWPYWEPETHWQPPVTTPVLPWKTTGAFAGGCGRRKWNTGTDPKADLQWERIRHLIVTHEHCDHLLGVVWVFRKIATMIKADQYKQDFHIWCHAKLEQTIRLICEDTFWYGRKNISPKDANTTPEASTSPTIWTFWIWRLTPERANECQAH